MEPQTAVLVGSAYPFRGGLASYNERLVKALNDSGIKTTIETFTLQYPSILFPGKTQLSSSSAPKDLQITRSVNSINPFSWISVGLKLKKQKPDFIIIKFWMPFMAPCFGTIARIAKTNKHSKIIAILDNVIPHEKRLGDSALTNYFISVVDGFITMSSTVLKDLDQFDKKKPRVLNPHPLFDNFGVAIEKQEAKRQCALDPGFKYILFFGFIREYKGLDLLLKAMAHPDIKVLPVKVVVAGEYYIDPSPYEKIVNDNHLKDKVVLRNEFIKDEEVAKYFCAADVVVQPYKDATQSGVTQIAYHFNKPMIVTDVGGLGEIVPDGKVGYVVKPEVAEISEAILKFFQGNREDEFTANAIIEKQKYSWEKMIGTIKELLRLVK